MNIESVVKEVQTSYDSAIKTAQNAMTADREQQARNAGSGTTVTFGNGIKDQNLRERAAASVGVARDSAFKAIDKAQLIAKAALTDAPTTDEANFIVAVSVRDDLTEYEAQAALDRYKSHAAQRAIRSAAKRSGIKTVGTQTQTELDIEALDRMRDLVNREFSLDRICSTSDSDHYVARNTFACVADDSGSLKEQFRKLMWG